jgi:tRNA pseudouridine38-40 synthase
MEKALRKLGWTGRSIILSGRTDTGVHATGQVAAADLDWSHAESDLVRALNAALPGDMAVWSAEVVDDRFHPRFDATSRCYRYSLFCQPLRDPIRERYAWRVQPAINPELLATAAALLIGTHDFSAFGSPTTPKGTTSRTVSKAVWTQAAEDRTWHFEVHADAFLYRMVRRMVFVQVAVAQGKVPAQAIAEALAKQLPVSPEPSRRAKARSGLPSGLAPAHGLTLVEVTYGESVGQ